ncbi:hypothetical protein N5923_23495 [Erwiniaceae bacterium BAC15a-03b]|uniref:Uncharacterized protein n=1 Tax=Winslowiella arboricola TaxID=2978220 RepID=A0A9J6PXJ3_9GAMM|nr:hypothetical protein [Winslowiella arboricola]MCU5775085.1 hypothetical protein [Winslowiella arboricola]MCU5780461.1 hypothetical protein [Winslowiella arboricola]
MDMEKAHEAIVKVIGEAVVQILAEERAVTNEAIIEMIGLLSDGEPNLAVVFAIDLLDR